mgnify:CR=1 FL=1|tara:strand:- start:2722 stop:3108 length:387 start_codon:yes stop_codon:yes gene_type:complete
MAWPHRLVEQGYPVSVSVSVSATQMGLVIAHEGFDHLVVDTGSPGLDGFEIPREIRRISITPIITLTARENVSDRIVRLERGVEDHGGKLIEPGDSGVASCGIAELRNARRFGPSRRAKTARWRDPAD